MKPSPVTALASVILLSLGAIHAAHAQAKGDKILTRDELRACMDSESELAARNKSLEARIGKNAEEVAAIKAAEAELAVEQKRVEERSSNVGLRARFERKVEEHNARIKAAQASADALQADLQGLNQSLAAHNGKCGAVSFDKEDRDAILKEREAARK